MQDATCQVIGQTPLTADYWRLLLEAPAISAAAQPGQFVHLRVPGLEPAALRRPFSIFGAADGRLEILYKTVGRGTAEMNRLAPGDSVRLIGPLGHGFPLDQPGFPLLVAGGYGVAPLCFLASRLPRRGRVFIGGRSADDVLACERFEQMGWPVHVATEDGSRGEQGVVTAPFDRERARLAAESVEVACYACGPDGMLRALSERAKAAGFRAWLSLDKRMVCGVGACLACVQQLEAPDGGSRIARVCRDGPVFEASEMVWQGTAPAPDTK